jgi:predicted amidohydrolase YtcJ
MPKVARSSPASTTNHVHLLATAAADESILAGPPQVNNAEQFASTLRAALALTPPGSWLRAVGYDETVSGDLDRVALDAIVPDHCVRVQHCSGALWVLNTMALRALGIESATGRPYRSDELLRERLGDGPPPALAPLGARLASYGVTGVTDATPSSHESSVRILDRAAAEGALPQSVVVMGGISLASTFPTVAVRWGAVKFVLAVRWYLRFGLSYRDAKVRLPKGWVVFSGRRLSGTSLPAAGGFDT